MRGQVVIMSADFLDRAETMCAELLARRHENRAGAREAVATIRKIRALRQRLVPAPEFGPDGWRIIRRAKGA
jgi:hypothetical protein